MRLQEDFFCICVVFNCPVAATAVYESQSPGSAIIECVFEAKYLRIFFVLYPQKINKSGDPAYTSLL